MGNAGKYSGFDEMSGQFQEGRAKCIGCNSTAINREYNVCISCGLKLPKERVWGD